MPENTPKVVELGLKSPQKAVLGRAGAGDTPWSAGGRAEGGLAKKNPLPRRQLHYSTEMM